jgi:acetyltransferase-like isoleucine patch superfamily enzyme
MNLKYWIQRLTGNSPCILGQGVRLYSSARLFNIAGEKHRIRVGAWSLIRGELLVFHDGHIEIGEWCYFGEDSRLWSAKRIIIGDRVQISHGVNVFDNLTHPLNPSERHRQLRAIATTGHPRDVDLKPRPVHIHNDVLVGCNTVILPGVRIGEGAVVGAASVVAHDVPPYCVVAGNPVRIIRELQPDER